MWVPGHHHLLPQVYKKGTALAPRLWWVITQLLAPFKETNPKVKEPLPLPNNFLLEPQGRSESVKAKEEDEERRSSSC